jgi:MinD-like ATPase involved in chromosome partitioning or flagellar assembly
MVESQREKISFKDWKFYKKDSFFVMDHNEYIKRFGRYPPENFFPYKVVTQVEENEKIKITAFESITEVHKDEDRIPFVTLTKSPDEDFSNILQEIFEKLSKQRPSWEADESRFSSNSLNHFELE